MATDEVTRKHECIAAPYVLAERERCARIAEACMKGVALQIEGEHFMMGDQVGTAKAIATAIRSS